MNWTDSVAKTNSAYHLPRVSRPPTRSFSVSLYMCLIDVSSKLHLLGPLAFLSTYDTNSASRPVQTIHQTSRGCPAFPIFIRLYASTNSCTSFQLSRRVHSSASTYARKPVQLPFIYIAADDSCIAMSRVWYLATLRTRLFRVTAACFSGPVMRGNIALHVMLRCFRNHASRRPRHSFLF